MATKQATRVIEQQGFILTGSALLANFIFVKTIKYILVTDLGEWPGKRNLKGSTQPYCGFLK